MQSLAYATLLMKRVLLGDPVSDKEVEPPRILRRLISLRGLSHEQEVEPVFT